MSISDLPASGEGKATSSAETAAEAGAAVAGASVSPEMEDLRDRLRGCLTYYHGQREDVAVRSPWGVMHTLIAYGVDTDVTRRERQVNAIGWLCWNGTCGGRRLFETRNGRIQPRQGPGYQGHPGQFLSMLALSRVPADYGLKADGLEFRVMDLVEHEKTTCVPGTELTFKLIGLVHYLPSDATWKSEQGEAWDIPRLIAEELAQPVLGATCGGTHRMMGFSYAVAKRRKRGEPLDGHWQRAQKYVDDFHEYAFQLQNADGSFSTNWFRGREAGGDLDRRLETTGHTLEWLVFSLPKGQLQEPRLVKSVDYLTRLLSDNRSHAWPVGARGHALHALALYDERVFGSRPGRRSFLKDDQPGEGEHTAPASR